MLFPLKNKKRGIINCVRIHHKAVVFVFVSVDVSVCLGVGVVLYIISTLSLLAAGFQRLTSPLPLSFELRSAP